MKNDRTMRNECYRCVHQGEVPGSAHIRCNRPDSEMAGNSHGIRNGWFNYPNCFDPVWKTKDCANFEEKK